MRLFSKNNLPNSFNNNCYLLYFLFRNTSIKNFKKMYTNIKYFELNEKLNYDLFIMYTTDSVYFYCFEFFRF